MGPWLGPKKILSTVFDAELRRHAWLPILRVQRQLARGDGRRRLNAGRPGCLRAPRAKQAPAPTSRPVRGDVRLQVPKSSAKGSGRDSLDPVPLEISLDADVLVGQCRLRTPGNEDSHKHARYDGESGGTARR